jgi:hypothetical protein
VTKAASSHANYSVAQADARAFRVGYPDAPNLSRHHRLAAHASTSCSQTRRRLVAAHAVNRDVIASELQHVLPHDATSAPIKHPDWTDAKP